MIFLILICNTKSTGFKTCDETATTASLYRMELYLCLLITLITSFGSRHASLLLLSSAPHINSQFPSHRFLTNSSSCSGWMGCLKVVKFKIRWEISFRSQISWVVVTRWRSASMQSPSTFSAHEGTNGDLLNNIFLSIWRISGECGGWEGLCMQLGILWPSYHQRVNFRDFYTPEQDRWAKTNITTILCWNWNSTQNIDFCHSTSRKFHTSVITESGILLVVFTLAIPPSWFQFSILILSKFEHNLQYHLVQLTDLDSSPSFDLDPERYLHCSIQVAFGKICCICNQISITDII